MFYLNRIVTSILLKFADKNRMSALRLGYVQKAINIGFLLLGFILVCFLFGLGYQQVFIFLSSFLAVLGIALVAQWSILSNITAGVIIFFAFPYRIGDRIKVVDKDDDISGRIVEIALFHVLIRRADGSTVTYPNSIILQKAVIKLTGNASPVNEVSVVKSADNTELTPVSKKEDPQC
ncbi:MAG: mechanosensitive ion channel family protein [Gammaproteobacteria bacterium]|jgi:small-conductance mechanosensitive channel|nr:mechanosensitive ion channel [Zhongshania sp.]MBU0539310.1 mechanosensitive ion channel family protein [Gammaproteobacteria bacterium]MBU1833949.1 mechanosensitive ion channel family protein [Gammaproteobacteria bacterium]